MMKRKQFMLGAIAGLTFAAAATAGGVIDWPSANAGPVAGFTGRLAPTAGAAAPAPAPPAGPLAVAEACSLNPKTRGTYLACGSGGGGLAPGYVSSRRCGQVVPK